MAFASRFAAVSIFAALFSGPAAAQDYVAPPPTLNPVVVTSPGGLDIMTWTAYGTDWNPSRKIMNPGESPDLMECGDCGGGSSDYWAYETVCSNLKCSLATIQDRLADLRQYYAAGQSYWDSRSQEQVRTAIRKLEEIVDAMAVNPSEPPKGW